MSDEGKAIDEWDACSAGELTNMVHRLDARQRGARRKQVLGTALVSTGVFACVVLALGTFMGQPNNFYGGIACSVCREHLADYQLHLIGDATFEDAELLSSVKTHLEKCTFCRGRFNELYPDQRLGALNGQRQAIQFALLPTFSLNQQTVLY